MPCSQLNVAVPGAIAQGMPRQSEDLIQKLQDPDLVDLDYNNDWKLITFFIGGNDLCRVCQNEVSALWL